MMKMMFIVMTLFCSILFAQEGGPREGGPHHGGPHGGDMEKGGEMMMINDQMLADAGIPDQVRAQIRKEFHEIKKKAMDIGFKVQEERLLIKQEMEKPTPDKTKVMASIKKIAELRKDQMLMIETAKVETMMKLSPDQRKKMIELFEKKRHKMMKHMRDQAE